MDLYTYQMVENLPDAPERCREMKLCAACNAELDVAAVECPACGWEQPHLPTAIAAWVLASLFVLAGFKACLWG